MCSIHNPALSQVLYVSSVSVKRNCFLSYPSDAGVDLRVDGSVAYGRGSVARAIRGGIGSASDALLRAVDGDRLEEAGAGARAVAVVVPAPDALAAFVHVRR